VNPIDTAAWPPIDLAWRQKVAAFWSITWPCWLASYVLISFLLARYSLTEAAGHLPMLSLISTLAFLLAQGVLVPRLVSKEYRSFRVVVVREDGQIGRRLSVYETLSVWLQIAWPQVVFLLGVFIVVSWPTYHFDEQAKKSINTLALWVRILVIGPSAVQIAMRGKYAGFRLQAYGQRYI
jgi:hypothetical protein